MGGHEEAAWGCEVLSSTPYKGVREFADDCCTWWIVEMDRHSTNAIGVYWMFGTHAHACSPFSVAGDGSVKLTF